MSAASPDRLVTPAFVALALSDLSYFTASGVLLATTPLFVVGPLDGNEAGVGVAMGSFSVTTLLLRPLAGRWADRRGRRPLLIGGAVAFSVAILGHYVVTGLLGLIALRLLLGAAEAGYFVAGFAALADLAPPGRAGEALSLNSLALYVGIAIGPLLGQGLLAGGGYALAWAGAAALSALAALLAARVPETKPVEDPAFPAAPLLHPVAMRSGFAVCCGVGAMSAFLAFAVLQARAVGLEAYSSVLVVFGATVVGCRLAFARLPDRMPPLPLAAGALAATAVGLLLIAAAPSPAGLAAGTVITGVGAALFTPAVFALVFAQVPAAQRGSAAATMSLFLDLGLGGGPVLLGLLAAGTSLTGGFLLLSGVPLVGAAWLLAAGRPRRVPYDGAREPGSRS
jgi:MFS family permease